MKVYDETNGEWMQPLSIENYHNESFQGILQFYLINTPVISLSAQAISLKDYGWNHPWNKKYYLNKQLKRLSTSEHLIFSAQKLSDMDDALTKAHLIENFGEDDSDERIAVYNNKKNQFISTFYHIRNSLAHGRFVIKEEKTEEGILRKYIFQDGRSSNNGFEISARMVLFENTLLKWASLISSGEIEYENPSKTQGE